LSVIWFFVNKGSKYWQENWEKNIEFLTMRYGTPIYGLVKVPQYPPYKLLKSFPYSVSKLNKTVSIVISLAWLFIICFLGYKDIYNATCNYSYGILYVLSVIIIAIFIVVIVHLWCKGFASKEYMKYDEGIFFNY